MKHRSGALPAKSFMQLGWLTLPCRPRLPRTRSASTRSDRAGLRRRAAGLLRRLADRALFHRRERLQRLADVRRGTRHEDRAASASASPWCRCRSTIRCGSPCSSRCSTISARAASMSASARARSTTSTSSSATACAATTAASAWRRRSTSSSARWREAPLTYDGKFHKIHIPALRPKPVQQPGPPLWRSVISPGSFTECGKLGVPILTARLPVAAHQGALGDSMPRASTRAATTTGPRRGCWRRARCGATSTWPNRDAQAEDELAGAARRDARPHDACARGLQSARLPARAGDAERLTDPKVRRLRGDPLRADDRLALRLAGARARAGGRAARRRRAATCSARPASAP